MGSKILVLGGAGAMAQVTVRDLVESRSVDKVGIADVNYDRANQFVQQLNRPDKASPFQADVRDANALKKVMSDFDVVVNSTWYEFNLLVMRAAIESGIHYLDLGGLYHTTLKQLQLDDAAKNAGVTCVLGIGSTPGTMNVMAAYGASKMDRITKIKLRSGSALISKPSEVFQSPFSIRTVLDEFTLPPIVLKEGIIREMPALSGKERFRLPDPVGELEGYFTLHSELATLPRTLGRGVRDMDFIVAYSPEFTNAITLFVKAGLASRNTIRVKDVEVNPYDVLATVIDSLPKGEVEMDVDIQRVELYGESNGQPLSLIYDAIDMPNTKWNIGGGTIGTGTPPSITAQWLADGKITQRGTVPPESCITPVPFFRELSARNIKVYENSGEIKPLF